MPESDMDEILEKFASKLTTENDELREYRMSMYKSQNSTILDQETRRSLILQRQKSLRDEDFDSRRGILQVVEEVESYQEEISDKVYIPSMHIPGFSKKGADFSNTLMLSEWMIEKPKDFSENWLVLACPKGLRVLLVAAKGKTKIYNKLGKQRKVWQSALPGGSDNKLEFKKSCILDGIWCESTQSVYVLDVLMWVNQPITDCDLDFRHNWAVTKFQEYSELSTVSEKNEYPIYLIPKHSCDTNALNQVMSNWPPYPNNNPRIDGFLFYHKEAHYIGGTTPLVSWLFPYMINELLGLDITVHEEYNKMKPITYTDQETFIKVFEEKEAFKKKHMEKRKSFTNTQINTKLTDKSHEYDNNVMVFGFDDNTSENQQVIIKKKKNRNKKRNKKYAMDLEISASSNEGGDKKNMELDISDKSVSAEKEKGAPETPVFTLGQLLMDDVKSTIDTGYSQAIFCDT